MVADAMRCPVVLRAVLAALLSLLLVQPAAAQSAQPSPPAPVLPVFIAANVPLDRAVAAEALATMPSLGLVIVAEEPAPTAPSVLVDAAGAEVRVRYRRAPGSELTRTLTPPAGPSQAAEAVALVIINLVHDETGDLLSLLAPHEDAETHGAAEARGATQAPDGAEAPEAARVPPEQSVVVDEPASAPAQDPPAQDPPVPVTPARESSDEAAPPRPSAARRPTACTERANHGRVGVDLLPMVGMSSYRVTREAVRGFSLNLAGGLSRGLHGLEIGGALNLQRSFACGLQIAGAVNVVLGPVRGLQIAPVNVALGRVDGVQIGVVNVARDVRGVQLGLLNISREAVAPIGLLSIVKRGRTGVHVTSSESGMVIAGVSHGGRVVHNLYGAGVRLGSAGPRLVLAAGLGARFFERGRTSMDLDAISYFIWRGDQNRQSTMVQLRLPIEVRIIEQLGVFIAPTYQWFFSEDVGERTQMPASLVTTYREASEGRPRILGWPGINVGARVHL
jgi:hypothetical protein